MFCSSVLKEAFLAHGPPGCYSGFTHPPLITRRGPRGDEPLLVSPLLRYLFSISPSQFGAKSGAHAWHCISVRRYGCVI